MRRGEEGWGGMKTEQNLLCVCVFSCVGLSSFSLPLLPLRPPLSSFDFSAQSLETIGLIHAALKPVKAAVASSQKNKKAAPLPPRSQL